MRQEAKTVLTALMTVVVMLIAWRSPLAHEQLTPKQIKNLGEEHRGYLRRAKAMELDRLQVGLRDQAVYKIQRDGFRAADLSDFRIWTELVKDQYPLERFGEVNPVGDIKTLTVLIDFEGLREADRAVQLDAGHFKTNIYGDGTTNAKGLKPWDSVAQYYQRASDGKLRLQGDVFGWYSMSGHRSDYTPDTTNMTEEERLAVWNQAYFDIAKEVLNAYDDQVDYSQYSNDQDYDIDLLTILYAGDPVKTTFWWKYAWQFNNADAEQTLFDGKRLKQFIICSVKRRSSYSDFNPRELIHEYGHALGLPDLYDRDPYNGPAGGVGRIDIMDQKKGNHNGFSRWLLGWIDPKSIGSGPPVELTLNASGAPEETGYAAVAVFPGLSDPAPPHRELFVVENRYRIGNDGGRAGMPTDGQLIWHINATLNDNKDDFKFNNSDTEFKLVRLVRAGNGADFGYKKQAKKSDYYTPLDELTPTSTPANSSGYGGYTGVVVHEIGPTEKISTAKIGFAVPPEPLALDSSAGSTERDGEVDLDDLDAFSQQLRFENPAQLRERWNGIAAGDLVPSRPQDWLHAQTVMTQWASKDGLAAVSALTARPESIFSRETFPKVMRAWAHDNPSASSKWYLDRQRSDVRDSEALIAGAAFARTIFEWAGRRDPKGAWRSIRLLSHPTEIAGAWMGLGAANCVRAAEQCFAAATPEPLCDRICRPGQ